MKNLLAVSIAVLLMAASASAGPYFADNFNDGVLDSAHWQSGGDGITEADGMLHMVRDGAGDYLRTVNTYSGDFRIDLDIRLNSIVWNDMFHGISLVNDVGHYGYGVSFGFAKYGKLYRAQHSGNSTSYSYGPVGSNNQYTWQHWTLEKIGSHLSILVDGAPVPAGWGNQWLEGTVPENLRISLPGLYNDGGSGGATSSDVDNFSIAVVPEPTSLLLLTAATAGLLRRRRS